MKKLARKIREAIFGVQGMESDWMVFSRKGEIVP